MPGSKEILYQLSTVANGEMTIAPAAAVTRKSDCDHRTPVAHGQTMCREEEEMPILIVALVALGAWIAIGVLLGSAVLLEQHTKKKQAH